MNRQELIKESIKTKFLFKKIRDRKRDRIIADINKSDLLWELADLIDWRSLPKRINKEQLVSKMKKKFDTEQILKIKKEYKSLEDQLKDYFQMVWLDDNFPWLSDDSYWDVISTIIGNGKEFCLKAVNDDDVFYDMAKNDEYKENFSYLFSDYLKENKLSIKYKDFLNEKYYVDLTPYEYDVARMANSVNIGWLDKGKDYKKGEVPNGFFNKLSNAFIYGRHKGFHTCPFCGNAHSSNVLYVKGNGKTYIFPEMLSHYIRKHEYKPPQEFIDVVMQLPDKEKRRMNEDMEIDSDEYKKYVLKNQKEIYSGRDLTFDENKKIEKVEDFYGRKFKNIYVGYWATYDKNWYGLPVENWEGWNDKNLYNEFVTKLEKKLKEGVKVGYRGWSDCRICGKNNGSEEYKIRLNKDKYGATHIVIPSGYIHYIVDHKIKPHKWFLEYIIKNG
jgi:hypothetical protein